MWIPERVWEQSMTSDLVAAGIQYTMLDDFHFKNAGLSEDQLHGYYLTEDDGNLLAVFPDSEPLRYMIPFASPQETIDYLGRLAASAARRGGGVWRRRRKARRLARDQQARLRRRLAGAVLRPAHGEPKLDQVGHAGGSASTARRRWARSICPRAAIAK